MLVRAGNCIYRRACRFWIGGPNIPARGRCIGQGAEGVRAPLSSKWLIIAGFLIAAIFAGEAMATVVWEDFKGNQNVGPAYVDPMSRPAYVNAGGGAAVLSALQTISVNASNAVRTGSAANIDWGSANPQLCAAYDVGSGTPSAVEACNFDVMGRVVYALVRFPQAGTYSLAVAHDDEVLVQLSEEYTNTNYRAATYGIPVGSLGGWTSEASFGGIGSFNAASANSCALIRVYWNNQGGQNFLRLRWTTPGGATEIIPASNLYNPGLVASSSGCVGSVAGTSVTLNKAVVGTRIQSTDQFLVEIASAATTGTVHRSATTTGAGPNATTGAYPSNPGTIYYLRDRMASGSGSTLAAYVPTIACARNGVAFTPAGASPNWNITPQSGDNIVCTITNTARPTVTVRKTSLGAAGTFAFTGGNGIANHSITTITPGTPVAGPRHLLTTTGAVTTITEGPVPAGFTLHGITCTGLGTGEATVTLGTRTVSLNAAATALGNAIECTFTNRRIEADLSVTKTNTPLAGPVDQANDVLLSGSQTIYEIVVSNAGPDAANGAILSDPPPTGLTCNAVTCSNPTGGAVCPAVSVPVLQGSGVTINTLPASSSLTFRLTCTVN